MGTFKYYAIIIDYLSRYSWLIQLKRKSGFFKQFVKLQKVLENRFGKKIKIFQSDGSGEFTSKEFDAHLQKCGIQQQFSHPNTSEQNGVAKRNHRHIIEMGMTLLFQSKLLMKYWVDAFLTFVFIINRLPSNKLKMESPFLKLFGTNPNYENLRSFGCRCYPYLRNYGKNKFSKRT